MRPGNVVLVDTNVIIEGHLRGCWDALTGSYKVQTVRTCLDEALTGSNDWDGRRPDPKQLEAGFDAVHDVTRLQIAKVALEGGAMLDEGEMALWAHALSREDAWILCGPDRASMRFGFEQQARDRLVSLGSLLREINHKPKGALRPHFEQPWLDEVIRKLILGIL